MNNNVLLSILLMASAWTFSVLSALLFLLKGNQLDCFNFSLSLALALVSPIAAIWSSWLAYCEIMSLPVDVKFKTKF